jgi:hypothetical protein
VARLPESTGSNPIGLLLTGVVAGGAIIRKTWSDTQAGPALVFDLGKSSRSDIAKDKDAVIAEAFAATGAGRRRR